MPKFVLPELPYSYDALEPYIDAATMEVHHTKHHQTYLDKLNVAIEGTSFEELDIKTLLQGPNLPDPVRNNGGGFYNHNLFWQFMTPDKTQPSEGFLTTLTKTFGSFENFTKQFSETALSVFGSGWVWLIKTNGELKITKTANQDNPLMSHVKEKGTPILCLDVWEHAYYLKYQNKRADYVQNWWNVVNWQKVEELV